MLGFGHALGHTFTEVVVGIENLEHCFLGFVRHCLERKKRHETGRRGHLHLGLLAFLRNADCPFDRRVKKT